MEKASKKNKGAFVPGRSGNPIGRPKGSKNEVTNTTRKRVLEILDNNLYRIQEDIDSLEPKDRLNFLEKLLQYSLPKLSAIKAEISTRNETGAESLSSLELAEFIAQIKKGSISKEIKDNDNPSPI